MRSPGRGARSDSDRMLEELQDLKKLAIIQLLASGVRSSDIAKALRVTKSRISGLVPVRQIQQHLNKA